MTDILEIPESPKIESDQIEYNEMLYEIDWGLSQPQKQIPSKFFYDELGCEIFNQITQLNDYYLTNAEIEILNAHKREIAIYAGHEPFHLIELGPGEGIKTQILIKKFLKQKLNFTYIPIDISKKYLQPLMQQLTEQIPELKKQAIHANYFSGLAQINDTTSIRKLLIFLGSSIGNFTFEQTRQFLLEVWNNLRRNDLMLIGFDLCRDKEKLMKAYDDHAGVTREFNLNLLRRLNREFQANFVLENFAHYAVYNSELNAMESFLICLKPQDVYINALNKNFHFDSMESIHVEYSFKYYLPEIKQLAEKSGFEVIQHFIHRENLFVDSLWRVVK